MTGQTRVLTPEVLALLRQGAAMRAAGDMAGLAAVLEQAAGMAPENANIQHDLGLTWLNLGKPVNALPALDRSVALAPAFGHAHMRRGLALEAMGRPGAADEAYRRAIMAMPDLADAYARLAALRHKAGGRGEAIMLYREAAGRTEDKIARGLYAARAALLEDDLDTAEGFLREVLGISAESHTAWGILGYIQKVRGDFAGAEVSLTEAIRLRPSETDLYYELVQIRKIRLDDTALIDRMRAALIADMQPQARVRLHQALAKAMDDIGDYPEAATQLAAASELQARHFPIDRDGLAMQVDRLIGLFTPDWVARADHRRDPSEMPILVLGMPRGGTTLTEQILSSHPMVAAGGELVFWQTEGLEILPSLGSGALDFRRTAEDYLACLRAVSATSGRVVDKNPFNFMWAGLVHLVFPNARIVHCRRHPSDTCLSAMFADLMPNSMFSNAIDDLVFYYRQYQRVMAHYRKVLPADRFLDVDYESLVEDPANQIRSLIAFCGLPWDPACLTPERNDRPVLTASIWQARQPIYRSSAGRRHHYERLLRPFQGLADGG